MVKPHESIRLRNNFQQLNAISTFSVYTLPRVDDLVTMGNWQIALTSEAKAKTAFLTDHGH